MRVGRGRDGGTAILSRHVAWPWSLPRGFRLAGRDGPLTVLPQAAGAALLPGDHWRHRIAVEDGHLHLVTAGAGLAHSGGPSRVNWQVSVAAAGRLAMLPDPWVLSPGAQMHQRQEIDLGPGADLAVMDGFCLRGGGAAWRSETVIRRGGRILLRDDQRVDPDQLARIAGLPGGMTAFGQILLVTDRALPGIGPGPSDADGVWGAASVLRGDAGILVRLAAVSGGALSAALDLWRARLRAAF
ncbi:urease accessory protein UreD [Paracoccus sp. YIM 132242]|uniref:Urease accessory protein UreD n=1 Tax=Paracoccus lichenicola TaxID=2665644 RepID=A0A6L6HQL3_9RHOB|nr:urease accessory protein UreD [Paracoccus lichenicola]